MDGQKTGSSPISRTEVLSCTVQVDYEIANFECQSHLLLWRTRLGNKPSRTQQEDHIKQEELDDTED